MIFSTLNLQNQIYTSKWYNNYNIALHCSTYSRLIFLLRSSNLFLPFTCLCPFFCSVVIPRSLPLWTWLFSSLGALSGLVWVPVLPSGSNAPWFWLPGPGPLWPLVLVLHFWSPGSSGSGLLLYCLVASLYYVICEWILPLWWTFSDHHWLASCQLVIRVVHWP